MYTYIVYVFNTYRLSMCAHQGTVLCSSIQPVALCPFRVLRWQQIRRRQPPKTMHSCRKATQNDTCHFYRWNLSSVWCHRRSARRPATLFMLCFFSVLGICRLFFFFLPQLPRRRCIFVSFLVFSSFVPFACAFLSLLLTVIICLPVVAVLLFKHGRFSSLIFT